MLQWLLYGAGVTFVSSYLLRRRSQMVIVGVTGGIGSGKSSFCRVLESSTEADLIDMDKLAHSLQLPGMPAWSAILKKFGRGRPSHNDPLLAADWTINRIALGSIVFKDAAKRSALNRIMRWQIAKALLGKLAVAFLWHRRNVVVVEASLLFESGLSRICDIVVCVSCDEKTRLERVMARDSCSKEEAQLKINAQMSQQQKNARAHIVISNSGDMNNLEQKALSLSYPTDKPLYIPTRFSGGAAVLLASFLACSYGIGDVFLRSLKMVVSSIIGS